MHLNIKDKVNQKGFNKPSISEKACKIGISAHENKIKLWFKVV